MKQPHQILEEAGVITIPEGGFDIMPHDGRKALPLLVPAFA